jgi:uncharacterized protein (DUF952 family)
MMSVPNELVHLCTVEEWERARRAGEWRPPSLERDGFVHLSAPAQVHLPANRLFAGRSDMVLLRLDPRRLNAPVRWEAGVPSDPETMTFPHLYGPLPVAAVRTVTPYVPDENGRFAEPPPSDT